MTREETIEAIKVMQHYADGGEVEARLIDQRHFGEKAWTHHDNPWWVWPDFDYRIKKTTKKIKLEAWMENADGNLVWQYENSEVQPYLSRVPSEDKWVEVKE
jgi:hypothetical protein